MLLLPPENSRGTLTKDLNYCAKFLHEKCLKAGAKWEANSKQCRLLGNKNHRVWEE